MILDHVTKASLYEALNPLFPKAFAFLRDCQENHPAPGRYDIDGDDLFAFIQTYDTLPDDQIPWEAHRKYIDIQCVLEGDELIGWAPIAQLDPATPYDEQGDCLLSSAVSGGKLLVMPQGEFAIFFPTDLHKPRVAPTASSPIIKLVIKVKA